MRGGSATHARIGFQDKVAALLSVHVVADAPVDFFGLPSDITPTSIGLETSAPVDDILGATSAAGFCFVNVKKGVTLSRYADLIAVDGDPPTDLTVLKHVEFVMKQGVVVKGP